jgi:Ca2+-binding EF-hand superfamily protein
MKRTLALGIAMLIAVTSTVLANEGKAGRWFDHLDTNGDGVITEAEMDARQTERFNEKDTNGDGMISKEEFNARAHARFARADEDGNGEITKEEFTAAMKEWREKHKESQ